MGMKATVMTVLAGIAAVFGRGAPVHAQCYPGLACPTPEPPAITAPPSATAGDGAGQGGDCIAVGKKLDRPIEVRVGTRLCAASGQSRAVINAITAYSVSYATENGARATCRMSEMCTFDWSGAPEFTVVIAKTEDMRGRGARLMPW